jgi:hypothetical protein
VIDSAAYFGRPGQVRRLYDPTGGTIATREIGTTTFQTGSGGVRVQKALNGIRQYALNYSALGRVTYDWLAQFHQGHMGVGPFVFLDPGRRNLLTVNQSSTTSATNDTRDFTVSGAGGTITSDDTLTTPLPRTLKWSFATTTPAAASLSLDKPSSVWPGIPVVVRPYTFWCMVVGGPVDLQLSLRWMDVAGTTITTSLSSVITTSATVWSMVALRVTAPPVTSCWVQAGVAPVVGTIASGESLYFSSFMLNEGDNPDEQWAPGTGVYPVQVVSLPERYGFKAPDMTVSPTLVLQEVR